MKGGFEIKMIVKQSEYIKNIKPALERLLAVLLKEYCYASVLAVDSKGKNYRVSRTGVSVEDSEIFGKRGYVIKVYDGRSYAEYSTNLPPDEKFILGKIKNLLTLGRKLPEGIIMSEYGMLADEKRVGSNATEYIIDPQELGDEAIINKLSELRENGMRRNGRILDCALALSYQKYDKLFLSKGRNLEQSVLWTTCAYNFMAERGEEIKYFYKGFSNLGGAEILEKMESQIPLGADTVLELLDSRPITPGEYDCICTPEVTGMIVHEAFGHGVEMDMYVKDRAQAMHFEGKYVASDLVTMHDGATAADEVATYFFDDEGTPAKDTVIIEKGILKRGISDAQSALYLGTEPTGNGRRESFERKAYTRMTNTFFEGGQNHLKDMIASIKYGFLLDNPTNGMEDPKNWGIQCMVNFAREIKDGKLTGKIFSPIVLTGYVPDLLKSISMVSPVTELAGCGYCGKGYKEWVKVSDGGPYIKARIRLG